MACKLYELSDRAEKNLFNFPVCSKKFPERAVLGFTNTFFPPEVFSQEQRV